MKLEFPWRDKGLLTTPAFGAIPACLPPAHPSLARLRLDLDEL